MKQILPVEARFERNGNSIIDPIRKLEFVASTWYKPHFSLYDPESGISYVIEDVESFVRTVKAGWEIVRPYKNKVSL